jgi:hypothetical protein
MASFMNLEGVEPRDIQALIDFEFISPNADVFSVYQAHGSVIFEPKYRFSGKTFLQFFKSLSKSELEACRQRCIAFVGKA